MTSPDIPEVHMTKPTFAEVCADAYAPPFGPPVLRIMDARGSVYITCVDRAMAEAAADAINAAIGVKP